ncbi:MAG: SCO family protein [Parvularculaceae bacterium]|nr:SCO family protein [Parvularculaceae bacterium]
MRFRYCVFAAFALFSAACGRTAEAPAPSQAVIPISAAFTGVYRLTSVDKGVVTQENFRGKTTLVYFGFTSCPDVCPVSLGVMSAALKQLSPKERGQIAALFITVDPDRDTTEALKAYLGFDPSIIGLTGDAAASKAARDAFKVYAQKRDAGESAIGYTMDHSDLFYLVGPDTKPRAAVRTSVTPEELAAILRRAIKGKFT